MRDAFLSLPPPVFISVPAMRREARERPIAAKLPWVRAWLTQAVIAALVLASLMLFTMQTRGYDAGKMLAAAGRHGPRALAAARALQDALADASKLDDERKVVAVNRFFNQSVLLREDTEIWGQADYWASPMEMWDKGAGDCEDFAIAKYFSLLALGMPVQKLRLVYVRAQIGPQGGVPQAHMVLAYYARPNAEPLIMDSLTIDVREASSRLDLSPVFSFNSDGLWQGMGPQSAGDPVSRLSRWREVLLKGRAEGFL